MDRVLFCKWFEECVTKGIVKDYMYCFASLVYERNSAMIREMLSKGTLTDELSWERLSVLVCEIYYDS